MIAPADVLITESRPGEVLAALHDSASAEREYLFAARDADPADLVLVAWEGEPDQPTAVGYIAATDNREDGLAIWEHLVVPSHRTRGLGRRLLGELVRRALPGAIVVVDPIGEYDPERIADYYADLGFLRGEGDRRIWATVTDVIRATPATEPSGSERSVTVRTLLDRKGSSVVTLGPEATVTAAIDALNRHHIGALVVSRDGLRIEGILSERDILTGLGEHGAGFLDRTIATVTTSDVVTCVAGDTIANAMELMTRRRVRHLPVTETGQLAGIISLGDLVSFRLDRVPQADTPAPA
ncbi:MAG: GNAT family N-acetyltransferase [Actinomycetota bacterium]